MLIGKHFEVVNIIYNCKIGSVLQTTQTVFSYYLLLLINTTALPQ